MKAVVRGKGFSAAHFVVLSGECERLHGHNYAVECEVEGKQNAEGIIVDFVELKKKLNNATDQLDHRLLIPANSNTIKTSKKNAQLEIRAKNKSYLIPLEDVILLPLKAITAEELARYIHGKMHGDNKTRVRVFESKSSWAEYP